MVKRMKKLSYLFIAIAILLSDIMCFVVAYNYRDMLCGIEHAGYSAPANVAFLSAIPFGIGIIICAVVAYTLHKKAPPMRNYSNTLKREFLDIISYIQKGLPQYGPI